MMKIPAPRLRDVLLQLACMVLLSAAAAAQQVAFAGLLSSGQQGQFNAVQADASGHLYLLLDQKDGVRVLKTDNAGSALLAQAKLGAAGDSGLALALDPSGNVYVTGTTTSTALAATAGAAITTRADASTNTFVAKFDANLNPLFVTLAGGSRIVPSGIAATADAVFITGFTYGTNLPVTASGIQQSPAYGSSQNGFVERFNSTGSTLVYATYLSGANGDTTPAAIAADASDDAYLTGMTSASGFPTIAAVVPAIPGTTSGFLTKLTPAGDGITFSTFLPGSGMNSIALAANGQSLVLAGNIALGQFPVDTVTMPLAATGYQVLLRMSLDGASVLSSTAIAPGTQSFAAPAADGTVWIGGALAEPLLPVAAIEGMGQSFAAHLNVANKVDQTARFGGLPNGNPSFASLPLVLTSVAVDAAGEPIVAGGVQPTAGSSLLATESYDLPLVNAGTAALPSTLRSAIPAAASCSGSLCPGYAAYLAKLTPSGAGPALALSVDAAPLVTLRNYGPTTATGLQIAGVAVTGGSCTSSLASGTECSVLLGGAAGTLSVSATNAGTQTATIPATAAATSTVIFSPREIDFGIQTSTSPQATRTVTVTNLGLQSQTFSSTLDSAAKTSPFTQSATDCTLGSAANSYTLAPGGSCHVTLGFSALSSSASDGILTAQWLLGTRDVVLTGYSQAAALSASTTHVDFGTQITGGLRLPRYLYLSNSSTSAVSHTAVTLPAGSPFNVVDGCPGTLAPASVCRIQISYLAAASTSSDSTTLALDDGISVLVTGQTLPARTANASSVNPNLSVSPATISFVNAVSVTGVSSSTQTVTVSNTGASAFTLNLALTGDFTDSTGCGASLAGGASCTAVVSFAPSQPGTRSGLLAVTAGANTTPAYVALSGTGTAILPANNGTLAFAPDPVGQPVVQWFKVSQPFTSLAAATTGAFTVLLVEDTGYGHGEPATTAYTAAATGSCLNCYVGLQFTPTAVGAQAGTLSLTSAAGGNAYVLALAGSGTASTGLILSPLAQDFGSVPLHSQSAPLLFALTNASAATVTFSATTITGDFAQSSATTGGAACTGVLAATATCFLPLTFAPTATGARTGSLNLTTSGGAVTASLTGSGTADPGLSLNPTSLTFSNVPGSTSTSQTILLGNTGTTAIQIGVPSVGTSSFAVTTNCSALAAGATCSLQVVFTPSSALVSDTLQIPVTSSGTNYSVPLNGAYTSGNAGLQILPQQVEYGPQTTGTQGLTRQIDITNLSQRPLTLNVALPRQFVLVGSPCAGLAPAASCAFSVAFLPLTNGDIPGTIFAQGVPSDGSATLNGTGYVEGFGLGSGTLAITGGSLINFGQVVSGQTLTTTLTLSNAGATPLTVRRITSQAPFFATSTCGATLVPGQSCTVSIAYTPVNQVAIGTVSPPNTTDAGTLVVESDAASSPNLMTLAGSAIPVAVASPANVTPLATFTVSQSSLTFATTQIGYNSAPQVVTLANTGTRTIHIGGVQVSTGFTLQSSCATLVAGASCTLTVTSTPQATGSQIGAIEIASDAVTPLEFLSLIGNGAPASLAMTPASLTFGSVAVGATSTLPIQVTNIGTAAVTFGTLSATGDYAVSGNCPAAGASLAASASCTLQIGFTPTTSGTRTGTLSVASSASALPLTVALTGTGGVAHLLVSPTTLAFGSIALGASASLSVTLTNTGAVPLTGLSLALTGDFSVATPCGSTSLAAGASCVVQINFTPAAVGARTGVLTIVSSDANSPAVLALSGTGTTTGGFTLTVDGGASSSASVTSGLAANYQLALTPTGGFTGPVALTCTPVTTVSYAGCSLLPSSLTLSTGTQGSTVTITTITEVATNLLRRIAETAVCLLLPVLLTRRRRARRLLGVVVGAALLSLAGCGGGSSTTSNSHLRYTPAGTYSFQITASSTTGPSIAQSVTVALVVQ